MLQFLFLAIVLAGLAYGALRIVRATANRSKMRTIGPDDDPDFLSRINHGTDPR